MLIKTRDDARRYFIEVRQKYNNNQALEPLEQLILDVILTHPEYHDMLEREEDVLKEDYLPEQGNMNPFLHMSMHIAIKEQIQTDRPAGISTCVSLYWKNMETSMIWNTMLWNALGSHCGWRNVITACRMNVPIWLT